MTSTYIIIRGHCACFWGSLYLDDYDEEDRDMKYWFLQIILNILYTNFCILQTWEATVPKRRQIQFAGISMAVSSICSHQTYMGLA